MHLLNILNYKVFEQTYFNCHQKHHWTPQHLKNICICGIPILSMGLESTLIQIWQIFLNIFNFCKSESIFLMSTI